MEAKLKINSCYFSDNNKAIVDIVITGIKKGSLVTIEGSDPSPVTIINSDNSKDIASNVLCENEKLLAKLELSIVNKSCSIPVFATVNYDQERYMLADVYILEDEDNSEDGLSIFPSFVSYEDKVSVNCHGEIGESVEFEVGERKFYGVVGSSGRASIDLPASTLFPKKLFSNKTVTKLKISANRSGGGRNSGYIHTVPKSMYALAAVEDVNRPSCVIMDPSTDPIFSLAPDSYPQRCFDEPLISQGLDSKGNQIADLEFYSDNWVDCDNAYVTKMQSFASSSCRIFENYKATKINNSINAVDDVLGPKNFKGDWATVWSACDPNPSTATTAFDPCNVSGDVLSKIPRIFLAVGKSEVAVDVIRTARMAIKKSPLFYHSAFVLNPQSGQVASIIIRLQNGDQISASVDASPDVRATLQALKDELTGDQSFVSSQISVSLNGSGNNSRLDFGADYRFTIKSGNLNYNNATNCLRVTLNSNYVIEGELTYPEEAIADAAEAKYVLILDGAFRGLIFPFSVNNTVITIDACPRVNTIGSFRVDQDYACMNIALLKELTRNQSNPTIVKLPFLIGENGDFIPASSPYISSEGSIVCSGVDGDVTYVYYHNGLSESEPWARVSSKSFDNPLIATDAAFGDECIVCETSIAENTHLHACYVGANTAPRVHSHLSSLWNKLSYSDQWANYVGVGNLDGYSAISSISGATLVDRDSVFNLSQGAYRGQCIVIYESLRPALEDHTSAFFSSSYESTSGSNAPVYNRATFSKGEQIASVLIHIDPSAATSYTVNLGFNGRIAKILASGSDLSRTDASLGFPVARGGSSAGLGAYPTGGSSNVSSLAISVGANSNSLVLNVTTTGLGVRRIRLVIVPSSDLNRSPDDWVRMASGDSLVSVPSADYAIMEMTPDGSECAAIARLYKDEDDTYFDGKFDQINFGVDCNIDISDINAFFQESKIIDSPTYAPQPPVGVQNALDPSVIINGIVNNTLPENVWHYSIEYIGPALSSRSPLNIYSSDYIRDGRSIMLDLAAPVPPSFSGLSTGDFCAVILFDIKVNSQTPVNQFSMTFSAPVAHIDFKTTSANYVQLSDAEYAASNPPGLAARRSAQVPCNSSQAKLQFSLNKDKKSVFLRIENNSATTLNHSFRVYLVNDQSLIFSPKNQNDVDREVGIIRSYNGNDSIGSNNMNFARSGLKYDSCLPLVSSCRFDDLNQNINSDIPINENQTGQLVLESTDSQYAAVPNNDSVAAPYTYAQNTPFRFGDNKSNLNIWGVVLLLEKETIVYTNKESPSQYNARTGSYNGYIESRVYEIFTGKAKLALVCNPRYSLAMDGSIGSVSRIVSEGNPFLIDGGFRLSISSCTNKLPIEYLDVSKRRDKLIPDPEDPSYHPSKFSSLVMCAVNGVPNISASVIHDMPGKSRQFDICFGNPYGEHPYHDINTQMPVPFRSGRRYRLEFSSIYLGPPKVVFSDEVKINPNDFSVNSMFVSSPIADAYIQNRNFNSSFSDPGNFVFLETDNGFIDNWEIISGGVCYVSSYASSPLGSRSVILESNVPSVYSQSPASVIDANFTFTRNRNSRYSSGVGGGIKSTVTMPSRPCILEASIGMRRHPSPEPTRFRTVMLSAGSDAISHRFSSRNGQFLQGDSPDYKNSRLLFDGTGSSMDVYINSLDSDIHKMICFSHSNYYGDGTYSGDYDSHFSSFYYFINADGELRKLYTDAIIMNQWAGNPQKATSSALIAPNVSKVASKGSATADGTGTDAYILYLKKDGSLVDLLEHGSSPYTLPSGNDFVDIAAGLNFGIALRKNGSIEAWGDDTDGVVSGAPSGKFVSVDCGAHFACALSDDGSIYCWGDNSVGQCNNPSGIYTKIRCGWDCSVALNREGYPSCWGKNPTSASWAPPSIRLRDAHVGGGPVMRIYPDSISALGGTSYPAGGDPLHDQTVIHTGEISRHAVGVTLQGDIITWGDDDSILVDETQDATALDNLLLYKEFSAIPNSNYIFVGCGPQGACGITEDGQILGFGSGQVPFQADGVARYFSYFKNESCPHKGGPFVGGVYAAPSYMIYEEDENPPRWAQLGLANEEEWKTSKGISQGRYASSLPITVHGEGINRSASIDQKSGRIHLAFESTRDNQNSICYASSYPETSRFARSIRITEGPRDRNKPSISVDSRDRKMIAWRERQGEVEKIACATSVNAYYPDPDPCFVDSCVLALRKKQSTDPYYIYSVQECRIVEDITFPSSASNVYFNVEFFADISLSSASRVAIYSSLDIPDNFSVSGEMITSEGISVLPNQNYSIHFHPPNDPVIMNSPLWYKITAISSANEYGSSSVMTDFLILKSTGTILDGFNDCTTGCLDQEGQVYVVYEGVQRYNFDIASQDIQSFNSAANVASADTGLFLPSNYNMLPGVGKSIRTMSYIVHISNNAAAYATNQEYSAKISFSSPIAAIVFDGDELDKTDGIAASNAFYPSASRRGTVFSPGTKIVISPDGSTIQINFISKQAAGSDIATQQMRIFTIETSSIEAYKTGIFGCDKMRNSVCGVQFVYNNDIGSTNNSFGTVHFRATIFSSVDTSVDNAIATFTTVTHPHMWSYGEEQFSSSGLFMYKNDSAGIGFYPDMISASSAMSAFDESDYFPRTLSNGSIYYDSVREFLLFDVPYRVRIDAIFTLDASLGGAVNYKNNIVEKTLFCNSPEYADNGIDYWKCSRTTGSDIVISDSNISGSPSVSSARQTFYIAFEKYSDKDSNNSLVDCPDICLAVWDAAEDRFDSSAQGGKDRIINIGYSTTTTPAVKYRLPQVITDDLSNFSILAISQKTDGSIFGKSNGSVGYQRKPNIISDVEDLRPCSFSDSLGERFSLGEAAPAYMKLRVDEKDVVAFKPSSSGNPYPIVSNALINLDVIGVPGAYAVRIRNEDDASFSPWIPIGGDVPVLPLNVSDSADYRSFQNVFRARFVSRDRFTMPWMVSSGEGNKTICVEVLTFFGKTPEFCTQLIYQPSVPNYKISFYAKSGSTFISLPTYRDYPVASPFAFAESTPQISEQDLRSIESTSRLDVDAVKFDVIFEDKAFINKIIQLSSLSYFKKRLLGRSAIIANVVYRGIDNFTINLTQDAVDKSKFSGSFSLKRSDGVYRKDGISLLQIDIPILGTKSIYNDFFKQMQEIEGQSINISNISVQPYYNSLIPPIDENSVARAFGNSEYYS